MVTRSKETVSALATSLIDSRDHPAFVLTESLTIVALNEAAVSLLGGRRSDYAGESLDTVLASEAHQGEVDITRTLTDNPPAELRFQTASGEIVPLQATLEELGTPSGSADYLLTGRDVYTIREDEEALRRSQSNFRELFDNSAQALFLHDPETGEITDVNRRMCDLYGYKYEEALDLTVADLSSGREPYTLTQAREHVRTARKTGHQQFEWEARHKDGSTFWVEVQLTPLTLDYETFILASVRDITERKRAENQLERREKRFRRLFNATAHAMLLVDRDGRVDQVNQRAEGLFDYDREDLLQKQISELLPEGTTDVLREIRDRLSGVDPDGEITDRWTLQARRSDGTSLPVEVGVRPFVFEGASKILVDVKDLSERRKIQRRLDQLSEATDDVLWMFNRDWSELLFVNSAVEDIFGVKADKLRSEPRAFLKAIHPEDRDSVREAMEELSSGEAVDFEYRVNPQEGYERWVWVNGEPVYDPDGNVDGVVGVARDITRRHKHRQELELKNHAMDSLQEGLIITDNRDDNKILYCNQGFLDLTGYDREDVLGRNCRFLQGEKTDESTIDEIRDALEAQEPLTVEIRNYRKDGSMFWNLLSITPVRDESGDVTHYIGIQKDISKRKSMEQDLKERTDRLRESNRDLKHFANVVTHDLKQPLRTVASYLELLEERFGDDLSERARDYLERSVRGSRHMKELLDRLRTYSTLNFSDPEFTAVDLNEAVDTALENLASEQECAAVEVGDLPVVRGDERLLENLFRNLIENALSYTEEDPRVVVEASETSDHHRIAVSDNGVGIPEKYHQRVFEAFERLNTDDDISGTGLGLSICRKIATIHDGDIELDTTPGEGSTFTLVLPRKNSESGSREV